MAAALEATQLVAPLVSLCRQYGPLTEDLISVLLQSDPDARPTAAQVLAIPAVRPHADAYVRRMRAASDRCVSPATPLPAPAADQRDTSAGNDVTPETEVGSGCGDRSTCASKQENDEKRSFPSYSYVDFIFLYYYYYY